MTDFAASSDPGAVRHFYAQRVRMIGCAPLAAFLYFIFASMFGGLAVFSLTQLRGGGGAVWFVGIGVGLTLCAFIFWGAVQYLLALVRSLRRVPELSVCEDGIRTYRGTFIAWSDLGKAWATTSGDIDPPDDQLVIQSAKSAGKRETIRVSTTLIGVSAQRELTLIVLQRAPPGTADRLRNADWMA